MNLLAELKRRNVLRVAGLYLVAAWLLVQVAATLLPMFGIPPWVSRALVLVLMIGFLPALAFAWFFELTPQGLVRDSEARSATPATAPASRRLDRSIIVVLALALGYFAVDKFVLEKGTEGETQTGKSPAVVAAPGSTPDGATASVPTSRKSIAVLPFTDLSPGKDQEYFSDGMAEEILNALAKVKDLKVAGRTSSFSYKGKDQDLRTMGQALGVANILEGSVRKQGDKVRITAQLIQTEDGFHLWSETYDGELTDVFELQERIARAITGELEAILSGEQKQRLVAVATTVPEAYALYLQATAAFNRRDVARFPAMIEQLEQALRLDPEFARAHARLASVQAIRRIYIPTDTAAASMSVESHASAASTLDPSLAEPYAALGYSRWLQRRRIASYEAFERALALDPRDPTAIYWFAVAQLQAGYEKHSTAMIDLVLQIDPLHPLGLIWRGFRYYYAGDLEAAARCYRRAADLGLSYAGHGLAHLAHEAGRSAEAIDQMASAIRVYGFTLPPGPDRILAAGIYGDDADRLAALEWIDAYLAQPHDVVSSVVPWALLEMGEPERALELLRIAPTTNDAISFNMIWSSRGSGARTSAVFPAFATDIGFTALWDKYGAPDWCHRIAPGNYRCE